VPLELEPRPATGTGRRQVIEIGMAIGDVGQGRYQEADSVGPSRNTFGWNCFEGFRPYAGCTAARHVPPIFEYAHEGASCSITGGYVLRDRGLSQSAGRYF